MSVMGLNSTRPANELRYETPARRQIDQRPDTLQPCLFFPGTDHPPGRRASVRSHLLHEELLRGRVAGKHSGVGLHETCRALLVGIDPGSVLTARAECFQARRVYPPLANERPDAADVDRAPGAVWAARRKPYAIPVIVDPGANPVDPAEAQGFFYGLRPCHARLVGFHLVEADQELSGTIVMPLQPAAELRWRFEEPVLHV